MPESSPLERLLIARETLPPEVREAVLALGADAVPPLMALLDDDAHCDVSAPGEGWAPVHAVGLLVELKAEEAIEPMLRILRETEFDAVVHDRVLLRLPALGAAVLEPALRHLGEIDEAAEETRRSFYALLSDLGVQDERVFGALTAFFDRDPSFTVEALARYGDRRALPRVAEFIAKIEPTFESPQWRPAFDALLASFEALGGVLDGELRVHVDGLLDAWTKDAARRAAAVPIVKGPKVGRNDPCPCESGKKYKKCCLGKEPALA